MEPGILVVLAVLAGGVLGGLAAAVALLVRRRPASTGSSATTLLPNPPGEVQAFITLDVDSIFDLYEQTRDAIVVRTTTSTKSYDLKVNTDGGPLKAEGGRAVTDETQTAFRPVQNATRAISIVERCLQDDGRITSFDLKAATDEAPLASLLKNLHADADRIGLTVPGVAEKELRRAWMEQSRHISDTTLESLGAFVRVRAEFTISPRPARGGYLLESVQHDDRPDAVRVQIGCPRSHLRPSFPEEGSTVTATCLGMPTWDSEDRQLTLRPIGIYMS